MQVLLLFVSVIVKCYKKYRTLFELVPETCSDMFRTTIESLFITYAQTTLNTISNVLNEDQRSNYYPSNNPWLLRGDEWCQNLMRRPAPPPKLV